MNNPVIYDVEVALSLDVVQSKWENPEGMGFASAVVYDYYDDQYHFFLRQAEKVKLIEYLDQRTVVSFNGIKFDSRVVLGNARIVNGTETRGSQYWHSHISWQNIDLLLLVVMSKFHLKSITEAEAKLGQREVHDGSISLDGLAEGTLGLHKTGHGAHAPTLFQEGRYAELLAYNQHDVRLRRKLYEFACKYRYLVDRKGNRIRFRNGDLPANPNRIENIARAE